MLLDLARRAVGTARAKLSWAFDCNAIGLPLAAGGYPTPIFAASAMVVSNLMVVLSSARLLRAAHGEGEPAGWEPDAGPGIPPRAAYELRPKALPRARDQGLG